MTISDIWTWILDLFRSEKQIIESRLEEVPLNFNFNNYDPHSPVIQHNKKVLKDLLLAKKISYKNYSEACTAMKRGWKNKSLLDIPPEEFSGKTITGSNFSQREPYTKTFPEKGIVGCTLVRCNCINCIIPAGITLVSCRNEQIKTKNDGEPWVVDTQLKPMRPLVAERYDRYGLSKDPKNIPLQPLPQSVIITAAEAKVKQDRKDMLIDVVSDPIKLQNIIDKGELI